ncbi:MAG: maltotransferase domain-containing protein, partial [Pirellulales bacterium]
MPASQPTDGRRRVAIENVQPSVDDGRFAVKRIVHDPFTVTADVFADGHDIVVARLLHRKLGASAWIETPMTPLGNDAWQASFELAEIGSYEFTIVGWIDAFDTWSHDLEKRLAAGQDVAVDLQIGAQLVVG